MRASPRKSPPAIEDEKARHIISGFLDLCAAKGEAKETFELYDDPEDTPLLWQLGWSEWDGVLANQGPPTTSSDNSVLIPAIPLARASMGPAKAASAAFHIVEHPRLVEDHTLPSSLSATGRDYLATKHPPDKQQLLRKMLTLGALLLPHRRRALHALTNNIALVKTEASAREIAKRAAALERAWETTPPQERLALAERVFAPVNARSWNRDTPFGQDVLAPIEGGRQPIEHALPPGSFLPPGARDACQRGSFLFSSATIVPPLSSGAVKRQVIKEIPYDAFTHEGLTAEWLKYRYLTDPRLERPETPTVRVSFKKAGLGRIRIKNEADRSINPTGTMKDRIARCLGQKYMLLGWQDGDLNYYPFTPDPPPYRPCPIFRYSILTAGNAGRALAVACERFNLPPIKLLLDDHTAPAILDELKRLRADIYTTDLSTNPFSGRPSAADPLTPTQIMQLTNNHYGFDLTAATAPEMEERWHQYYERLVEDVFAQKPDEIYVPYGSGMLFDNFIYWQQHADVVARDITHREMNITGTQAEFAFREARNLERIQRIKIFGAAPRECPSVADKLAAPVRPYVVYDARTLQSLRSSGAIPIETSVCPMTEGDLAEGYRLMEQHAGPAGVESEPSGSAGLALYAKRFRDGLVQPKARVVVVNTGSGLR